MCRWTGEVARTWCVRSKGMRVVLEARRALEKREWAASGSHYVKPYVISSDGTDWADGKYGDWVKSGGWICVSLHRY